MERRMTNEFIYNSFYGCPGQQFCVKPVYGYLSVPRREQEGRDSSRHGRCGAFRYYDRIPLHEPVIQLSASSI